MDSKSIRRLALLIGGLASTIISVFLLFYLDIVLRISVVWLMLIALTGLIGGVLVLVASASILDEDNVLSRILAIIGTLLIVALNVVLIGMYGDPLVVEYALYHKAFVVVYYIIMGLTLVNTVISIYGATFEEIE